MNVLLLGDQLLLMLIIKTMVLLTVRDIQEALDAVLE